jgi:hypothetical protein
LSHALAAAFFLASTVFVWRSFYSMRIRSEAPAGKQRFSEVARGK